MRQIRRTSSQSALGLAAVVVTLLSVAAPFTAWADGGLLWDEAHLLSSRQRGDIEKRLAAAARRLGSPVFILVTDTRRPETVAAVAARTFNERQLGGQDESNPVLLVLSVRQRAAAIETGKGNAGIVPEIDAVQITKRLQSALSRGDPNEALERAIDEIVVSAQATAARRRPSAPDEDLPPPDATHMPTASARPSGVDADADASAAADAGAGVPGATPGSAPTDKARGRSRFSIAAAIAVLVLLALALRRRRQLTAARKSLDKPQNSQDSQDSKGSQDSKHGSHPRSR